MKYSDFKKLVIENMPKNSNPGLWKKKESQDLTY